MTFAPCLHNPYLTSALLPTGRASAAESVTEIQFELQNADEAVRGTTEGPASSHAGFGGSQQQMAAQERSSQARCDTSQAPAPLGVSSSQRCCPKQAPKAFLLHKPAPAPRAPVNVQHPRLFAAIQTHHAEEHPLLFPEPFTPGLLLDRTWRQRAFPTPLLHFTSFSRLPQESPSLTHSVASRPVTHHPHQPLLQIFMLCVVFFFADISPTSC